MKFKANDGSFAVGVGTVIEEDVSIGPRTKIGYNCSIKGGDSVSKTTMIGEHVYISHMVVIAAGTIIEDDVFIGPSVVTMNTKHICHGRDPKYTGHRTPVIIRRGARIGGGVVILPGVEIGEEAEIGVGSVVVKDCEPYCTYVGNPARKIREVPPEEHLIPKGSR